MRKKLLLWIGGISILLTGGLATYFLFFSKSSNYSCWNFVPPDAAFIIETNDVLDAWDQLKENKIWQHLLQDPLMKSINEDANYLDEQLANNSKLYSIMKNRPMLISCHLTSNNNYDFLFIIDLKKARFISLLKDFIFQLASQFTYDIEKEKFENEKIYIVQSKPLLYFSLVENIVLISYTKSLVQQAILQGQKANTFEKNQALKRISTYLSGGLCNIYFFQPYFNSYLSFFTSEKDILDEFKKTFTLGAYTIQIDENQIKLKGALYLNDTSFSLLHSLHNTSQGKIYSHQIIPDNLAYMVSLTFENFPDFLRQLKEYQSKDTSLKSFEPYEKRIQKAMKLFGIDVEKHFFSWIGQEISIVKLPPFPNVKENDYLFIFHTNDIKKAYENLQTISKKISRWIPIKEKEETYKNYTIHYFGLKGFFKLFFGKLFASFEKPYYIFLEDFVVFSNSPTLLMYFIDKYEKNLTLANNENARLFFNDFSDDNHIRVVVQGPRIFQHLYRYTLPKNKDDLLENKGIFTSFKYLDLTLNGSEKGIYQSSIAINYDENAWYETELLDLERDAEDIFTNELDSIMMIDIDVVFDSYDIFDDGTIVKYYENQKDENLHKTDKLEEKPVMLVGRLVDNKKEGLWKYYYESGNLWATVPYQKGKIDGRVIVYYDQKEPKTKIICEYKKDKREGQYIEYYLSGKTKAKLNYVDDQLNGEAIYFYESGNIKIEGYYKNGEKEGKWKYYTELGEVIDKEKWKKGSQKR
ncbi:MAG: DUF3352 domain-containing protein [Bacteroidales bacterium]|nr:DUF3352 domain-containing protein [Bacteroidales bacterium]